MPHSKPSFNAFLEYWNGDIPGVSEAEEFTEAGLILQFDRPPPRINLLNRIEGGSFEEAWLEKREGVLASESDAVPASRIGLEQRITNKEWAGRPKDDLRYLKQVAQEEAE